MDRYELDRWLTTEPLPEDDPDETRAPPEEEEP